MRKIDLLTILITLLYFNICFSQCFIKNERILGNYTIYDKLDSEHYNTVIEKTNESIKKVLQLNVKYGFYDDSYAPNAMAMPIKSEIYDGQAYVGKKMLSELIKGDNINADIYKITYILSHEYAHIMQYKRNHFYIKSKHTELQADFIAGYVSAVFGIIKYNPDSFKDYIVKGASVFQDLGDTSYASPTHHGTHKERMFAFLRGAEIFVKYMETPRWKKGNRQLIQPSTVWKESVNYINTNFKDPKTSSNKNSNNERISEYDLVASEENETNANNQSAFSEETSNCVEYLDTPKNIKWSYYDGKIKYKGCKAQKKAKHKTESNWLAIYEGKNYILLKSYSTKEIIKINKDLIKVYNVKKVSKN